MVQSLSPRPIARRWLIAGALFLLFIAGLPARAQSGTEIIRGRIFGPDSLPLPQVEVLVTGLSTRASQTARTDDKGVYTLLFANPEGDYLVAIRKLGFASSTFRLTRTGLSSVLGADIYMKKAIRQLDTVAVTAQRLAPGANKPSVGEVNSSTLADSLFLADPTRLMQLLMSLPGIFAIDDSTFSVMGASSDQNRATVDGGAFRGTLPPDAVSSVRVITSSSDPAQGNFAGGNVSSTLRGGTDIFAATVRGSTSNRTLAWADANWPSPLARTWSHSGTAGGPLKKQVAKFNLSWNLNDRVTDWYSLVAPRGSLLAQQGIRMDTVAAVTSALAGLGIPTSTPAIPRDLDAISGSTSEVLDLTPNATTSIRLSHSANWGESINGATSVTAFPTRANQNGFNTQFFGGRLTGYVHGLLDEFNASLNTYGDHSTPYSRLPSAAVRVGTDFNDGRTGFTTLGFAGGTGDYYEHSGSFEMTDELSWLPKSGAHKLKVGGRYETEWSEYYYFPGTPLLGNYNYLSLADLAANKPASYDRVLNTSARNTRASNYSTWVGDEWMQSKALQFQGGLRFDFANPITRPVYNPAADSLFQIHTDRIPNDVGISPRLGFSWSSAARRGQGTSGGSSSLGGLSAAQLSSLPPELVMSLLSAQRSTSLPGIGVNGNFGAYRGVTSTSTIADYVESTGLNSRVTLSCVGADVPIPNWQTLTDGPTTCANGASGSSFSLASPLVRVFDPTFKAPLSWRGSVGIDGIRVPAKWIVGVNASYAWNQFGASSVDRNLNRTPLFFLVNEANRPVYVQPADVVPSTGTNSVSASRISRRFSTVSSTLSDLNGYSAQLGASLAPPRPIIRNRVSVTFNYALTKSASQSRGFSRIGNTGDPFEKVWVPTTQPLQSFRMSASGRVWWFNFNLSSFLQSSVPLTPLVSGDINGDGNINDDRAFIPDPSTTADTSLARQMNDLLSHAPSAARKCLTSQFGKMAGANSCQTPWQARIDVSASVTPPSSWGYSDRLRFTMQVANASGGLVRLLHLENTPLGQSTLSTTPNPTLLYVTGFDPVARSYKYRVNQLFGEPTNYGSLRRKFAPLQIQLGAEYKFGGPTINPISRGLGLREQVGQPELTDAQRREAVAKLKKDPTVAVLQMKDSLALSSTQVDQLASLSRDFNARADTALESLTRWVIKKGKRVADQDLSLKLTPAQSALAKLSAEYSKKVNELLSPAQQALMASPKPAPKKS